MATKLKIWQEKKKNNAQHYSLLFHSVFYIYIYSFFPPFFLSLVIYPMKMTKIKYLQRNWFHPFRFKVNVITNIIIIIPNRILISDYRNNVSYHSSLNRKLWISKKGRRHFPPNKNNIIKKKFKWNPFFFFSFFFIFSFRNRRLLRNERRMTKRRKNIELNYLLPLEGSRWTLIREP